MTSDRPVRRFGRVVIDDQGIAQRPLLLFFGRPFRLEWADVTAWAVGEMLVHDARSGGTRVESRILELQGRGNIHFITRPEGDEAFLQIVEILRRKLPQKETESRLAEVGRMRQELARKDQEGGGSN